MQSTINPSSVVIWSADVSSRQTLFGNLDLMPELKIVKADRLLQAKLGPTIVDELNERGVMVFDDSKLVEIPPKLEDLAKLQVAHRPWMLNCMAGSLSNGELTGNELDALKRFSAVCLEADVRPCGVTVLTTKSPSIVKLEFNGRDPVDQVLFYVEWLIKFGFTDVVCSPQEAMAIRAEFGNAVDLNCPGVRMPDSPPDDQARTLTPYEAMVAGVTRTVIGRPITTGDVAANLAKIFANITAQAA